MAVPPSDLSPDALGSRAAAGAIAPATSGVPPTPAQAGKDETPAAPPRKAAGGRPTKAAAAALERRILDTAATLFATQGYAATSMEQVAEACQAGKDTIYRRYRTKAELFTALLTQCRSEVLAELDACTPASGTPLQRLQAFAWALLEINLRPQLVALNRVALGEAVFVQGVEATPSRDDPFLGRLAALVAEAQAAQQLVAGEAYFLAEQLLYATSIKPLIATMLGEGTFATEAARRGYFEQAWGLFVAGAGRACP